jgi:hypothetical protein
MQMISLIRIRKMYNIINNVDIKDVKYDMIRAVKSMQIFLYEPCKIDIYVKYLYVY